jgi:glycosyltransferase involved in cell wall biosynthesis
MINVYGHMSLDRLEQKDSCDIIIKNNQTENMARNKKIIQGGNKIPMNPVYAGVCVFEKGFHVCISENGKIVKSERVMVGNWLNRKKRVDKFISSWLRKYAARAKNKIIAVGIVGHSSPDNLRSELWIKQDIVCLEIGTKKGNHERCAQKIAEETESRFDSNGIIDVRFNLRRKVATASLNSLEDIAKTVDLGHFELLKGLACRFNELKGEIVFFSATPRGGGVAIMRHSLMRIFKLLGVRAHWHVLSPKQEVFEITKKKFHNVLQAVAPPDVSLRNSDKKTIREWANRNANKFKKDIINANVIVIDDPQPASMISSIKRMNSAAKIIYRSHIQLDAEAIDTPQTPQNKTWNFLWDNIKRADLFISQPCAKFLPQDVPREKTVFMPPATDKLDGLNKELTNSQENYYLDIFNSILRKNGQGELDLGRPYIIQIARFDPSKGFPDVIESYHKLRMKLEKEKRRKATIPQLVICGHGSIDDPEGDAIFSDIISMLELDRYRIWREDIKVVRLPHIDQLFNTLLRRSMIALQLSHKEGFEFKVTEALDKGIPVVAYRAGGIPLQIKNGINGFLVKVGSTQKVASHLYELVTNKRKYRKMSNKAKASTKAEHFMTINAAEWLFLATQLLEEGEVRGYRRQVIKMMSKCKLESKEAAYDDIRGAVPIHA